ncbi:MAG: hypothetical protein V1663_01720 [archaeon]
MVIISEDTPRIIGCEYEYEIIGELNIGILNLYYRHHESHLIFKARADLTPFNGNLEEAVKSAVASLHKTDDVEYKVTNMQGKYPAIHGILFQQQRIPVHIIEEHVLAHTTKRGRGAFIWSD